MGKFEIRNSKFEFAELTPFSLPFDEALAFFASKGYEFSPESWRDVWQAAHARAFTVARVTTMDVLVDIRAEVTKALEKGVSLRDFKSSLRDILERKGWFAPKGEKAQVEMPDGTIRKRLTPWRLETIWRTNLQTAYSTGRYQQQMEVAEKRPFWQYKAILDEVTRRSHAAMNNKVYDYRHPIWDTWYPPNGFHCRCYVKTLSARQVRDRGLDVETKGVDFKPDDGWAYNPGKAGLDAINQGKPSRPKLPEDIETVKPDAQEVDFVFSDVVIKAKPVGVVDGIGIYVESATNLTKRQTQGLVKKTKKLLSAVPEEIKPCLQQVFFATKRNPHDVYWAEKYKMPGFESYATAGNNRVTFWQTATGHIIESRMRDVTSIVDETLFHEIGHLFTKHFEGRPYPEGWRSISRVEGWTSSYSEQSANFGENFAESFAYYHVATESFQQAYPKKYKWIKDRLEGLKGASSG